MIQIFKLTLCILFFFRSNGDEKLPPRWEKRVDEIMQIEIIFEMVSPKTLFLVERLDFLISARMRVSIFISKYFQDD